MKNIIFALITAAMLAACADPVDTTTPASTPTQFVASVAQPSQVSTSSATFTFSANADYQLNWWFDTTSQVTGDSIGAFSGACTLDDCGRSTMLDCTYTAGAAEQLACTDADGITATMALDAGNYFSIIELCKQGTTQCVESKQLISFY